MFAMLAKAGAGALYKLVSKLPMGDAAVVLTRLPNRLAIQVIAYYPPELQAEIGPAMVDARWAEPGEIERIEAKIRSMLQQAKQHLAAKNAPEKPALPPQAKELAKAMMRPGPKQWTPRQATSSPINGPAVPGASPPVAGDPFASPLAQAGLLDLIGRAQEKFLPKGKTPPRPPAAKAPAPRLKPGKNGKPEPLEGLLAPDSVKLVKTPRVIGPKAPSRSAGNAAENVSGKGARRMDGKAILAAILRESDQDVRKLVRHDDPALFKQLRERMFYFDDLALTDDNALARVFTAAPTEESALALKFAAPALREKVLRSVSPGRARALREHAGVRAGLDEAEKAQQTVLDVALQLQAAGRILIDPRDPDLAGK